MDARVHELPLDNARLAQRLAWIADLLEAQEANPFRTRAYRRAADTVRMLAEPVHVRLEREGLEGLTRLPGIGSSLARTIEQLVYTDHLAMLERVSGGHGSVDLFASVPGIGPGLARRIHEELGIESLAELEAAAYDGRLAGVPGLGERRLRSVRESLAGRFRRHPRAPESRAHSLGHAGPTVAELLDVDREYRERAERGELTKIAPRRFNPQAEAWLPILHAQRGWRHYTVLFSNTARAHELGTTHDWVVIYRDDDTDGQWTVVSARSGSLNGLRVVRGREAECELHYRALGRVAAGREPQ